MPQLTPGRFPLRYFSQNNYSQTFAPPDNYPLKNSSLDNYPRAIATYEILRCKITPRTISPHEISSEGNCPPEILLPGIFPWIIPPEKLHPDNATPHEIPLGRQVPTGLYPAQLPLNNLWIAFEKSTVYTLQFRNSK